MSMSLRENITAVIETCFSETKDEIQDTAINRILELIRADRKTESIMPIKCESCKHWYYDGDYFDYCCERFIDNLPCMYEPKTENSSEKPNNSKERSSE